MPTQLQIRRGSTTDHNSFTGAAGELTVDTTKDTLRVHDGSTAGGFELARADGSNLNNITSNITVNGTVTADGLTVDGVGRIEETGAAARLTIARTDASNSAASASLDLMENNSAGLSFGDVASFGYRLEVDGSTNKFNIISGNQTTTKKRFSIDRDTGDISFYEFDGDNSEASSGIASAERLGVGTTSPSAALEEAYSDVEGLTYYIITRNSNCNTG